MNDDVLRPATLAQVSGAQTPGEAAQAIVAGSDAPDVLHFSPEHPKYDPYWCERLRGVYLNQVELTDVVGFDIPRGEVEILQRDEKGKERHTYVGPSWFPGEWPRGRLRYLTATRHPGDDLKPAIPSRCPCGCGKTLHLAVEYGVRIHTELRRSGTDRRSGVERRQP